ncbi:MAG: beta-galactosidase [Rudaea sp.]
MFGVMRKLLIVLETLAVLAVVGLASAPPPILILLGPPQNVATHHPKVGVHTRLTEEPEEWKIQKTFEMVREMGAPWVVEYFPWDYIEHEKGQYDWTHADQVVDHARAQGLTVVARLGLVPAWARPADTVNTYLGEEHYQDFAEFAATFAEHYRGRVNYLIIWNEPNTNFEWGQRSVDPSSYVALLKASYLAVKARVPEVKILGGALAPNLAPPGATDTMNDLEYLDKMYAAGARDYMDILAAHAYGWKAPADQPASPDRVNFRRTELLHEIMVRNGDGDKQIMVTEGGWNDSPRWTKAVSPPERITYTLQAYDWCEQTAWVQSCALWVFRFPAPSYSFNDYWTFVTPQFDPRPIYYEVQRYAQGK